MAANPQERFRSRCSSSRCRSSEKAAAPAVVVTIAIVGFCLASICANLDQNTFIPRSRILPLGVLGFSTLPTIKITKTARMTAKSSSSSTILANSQFLQFDMDRATHLTDGSISYPPMVSVPCSLVSSSKEESNKDKTTTNSESPNSPSVSPQYLLKELVKPPNVEALYEWYCTVQNQPNADPSWAVLWPTAVSLSQYLLQQESSPTDSISSVVKKDETTVVELGAGLGLCGIVAAKLGAKHVVLTDREPFALHCAMATAACNGLSPNVVQASLLEWSNPKLPNLPTTTQQQENDEHGQDNNPQQNYCDLVLASDVLYDGETIRAFCTACESLIDPHKGGVVLVADPKVERFSTAREMLKETFRELSQNRKSLDCTVLDLPPIGDLDSSSGILPTTMDGKDHYERMKEPTVLIRCTLGPRL